MAPGKAYTDHQFHSNSYTGPRPTPTIPTGGLFSIYASTQIPTPPIHPYNALLDIRRYHIWNTYIPTVLITKHPSPHSRSLRLKVGTFMTLTYALTPTERTESKEVVRHLEALKTRALNNSATGRYTTRIRWTMDNAGLLAPGFMLKTERVLEVEEREDGNTEFRTWISFKGLGAKMIKRKWERVLQERNEDFVRDLRKRSLVLMREGKSEEVDQEEEGESEEVDEIRNGEVGTGEADNTGTVDAMRPTGEAMKPSIVEADKPSAAAATVGASA